MQTAFQACPALTKLHVVILLGATLTPLVLMLLPVASPRHRVTRRITLARFVLTPISAVRSRSRMAGNAGRPGVRQRLLAGAVAAGLTRMASSTGGRLRGRRRAGSPVSALRNPAQAGTSGKVAEPAVTAPAATWQLISRRSTVTRTRTIFDVDEAPTEAAHLLKAV
jgi:hypothetical protein